MGSFRGAGTLLALGIQCRMRKRTKSSMGLDSASSAQGGPGLRVRTRGWESEGGKGRSQVRPSRRYKRKQNLDPALRAQLPLRLWKLCKPPLGARTDAVCPQAHSSVPYPHTGAKVGPGPRPGSPHTRHPPAWNQTHGRNPRGVPIAKSQTLAHRPAHPL